MNNEKSEEMTSNVKDNFVSIIITSRSNIETYIINHYKEDFFRNNSDHIIPLHKQAIQKDLRPRKFG